jgi:hypothetical protein
MKDNTGTKDLFLLRPRCIRAERPRNPHANQSMNMDMDMEISPLEYKTNLMPQSVGAN